MTLLGPSYAQLRPCARPSALVAEARRHLGQRLGHALDLGAGALKDTRYLLRRGFSVDAVDIDPLLPALARQIDDERLNAIQADLRELKLEVAAYDLVVAIHVLPLLRRHELTAVMPALVASLKPGGLLCCTLFGQHDGWAGRRPRMTFLSRPEIDALLSPLQMLTVAEDEYDGVDAFDQPKRWHIFRCILQRAASGRTGA